MPVVEQSQSDKRATHDGKVGRNTRGICKALLYFSCLYFICYSIKPFFRLPGTNSQQLTDLNTERAPIYSGIETFYSHQLDKQFSFTVLCRVAWTALV